MPTAVGLAAGAAVGGLDLAADGDSGLVLAAKPTGRILIGGGRRNGVGLVIGAVPTDGLAVGGLLNGLADTVLVDVVHGAADGSADDDADDGAADSGCRLAAAAADLGAQDAANGAAEKGANILPVAGTERQVNGDGDLLDLDLGSAMFAATLGLILHAIAVGGCPRRRVGQGLLNGPKSCNNRQYGADKDLAHDLSPFEKAHN